MFLQLDPVTDFILASLENSGFSLYIVGGSLRNRLLGLDVHDTDFTTNATPAQVKQIFSSYTAIDTGIRHGTVTLVIDHVPYEITTMRTEGTYSDNRRPDCVFYTDSIEEDLKRRDFTVNALAYSPKSGLVDLFGGLSDLENRVLRTVGEPAERFSEDALRIMRGLRFSSVLGFEIENETKSAMFHYSHLLKNISVERIYNELISMLDGNNFDKVLRDFLPVFKLIMPEMRLPEANLGELPKHLFRLASLFEGETEAENCLHRLKADNFTIKTVKALISREPIPFGDVEIKKYLRKNQANTLDIALFRETFYKEKGSFSRVKSVLDSGECYSLSMLAVNGNDIASLGFSKSEIGEVLEELLDKVISRRLDNKKEVLIEAAKIIDKQ